MPPKLFKLVDPTRPVEHSRPVRLCWELCVLCQTITDESLQCPALQLEQGKTQKSGYNTMAENLQQFSDLGALPKTILLDSIDEGQGIEAAMTAHKASWHRSCRLKLNNTELQRARKRAAKSQATDTETCSDKPGPSSKRTRSSSTPISMTDDLCFFCGKESGAERLHEVTTFNTDLRVRESAAALDDTELLGRLSTGDMVALEAKYHAKCLASLYNRAAKVSKADFPSGKEREATLAGIAFAELITYIEDARDEETLAPVFKLVDLTRLYSTRLQQLGVETKVHSTRLKQRILGQIPDMQAYPKGRDTLLVFDADIGLALTKACERDSDSDAIHLARAAQIVRMHMFHKTSHFDGSFGDNCQEASVPDVLLALINMILEGPSIKEQSRDPRCQAALSMAQLLKFNSVKSARKATDIPKPVKHVNKRHLFLYTLDSNFMQKRARKS